MFEYLQSFQGIIACDGMGNVRVMPAEDHYVFETITAKDFKDGKICFSITNSNCGKLEDLEDDVEAAVEVQEDNWFIRYDN